jgi:hypothetical protein
MDKESEKQRHKDKYYKNRNSHLAQKKEYEKTYSERRAILTLMRKYGLTEKSAKKFYLDSMKTCDCCKIEWNPSTHTRRFAIDHDHDTGAIRGILCHPCNASLGLLEESTERMKQLILYTEDFCNK